jgi:hypothetical protein
MMMLWRRFAWELTLLLLPASQKLTLGHLQYEATHLRLVVEITSE